MDASKFDAVKEIGQKAFYELQVLLGDKFKALTDQEKQLAKDITYDYALLSAMSLAGRDVKQQLKTAAMQLRLINAGVAKIVEDGLAQVFESFVVRVAGAFGFKLPI